MKWSLPNAAPYRKVAPLLLLALGACSHPQSPTPLLVDSELGQPLADTRRSGDTPLDRQREPLPPPRVQHQPCRTPARLRRAGVAGKS